MFYAEDKTRLRHAMADAGLREVRFRFDFEGTKVVHPIEAVGDGPRRRRPWRSWPAAWPRAWAARPAQTAQGAGARSPAGPSSPTSSRCCGATASAGWCSASAISARQVEAHLGDGAAHGLEVRYSYDGDRAARHRRRAAAGRALLGDRLLGALRRQLPGHRLRARSCAAFAGERALGADDRASQRGPLGPEQRALPRRAPPALRQAHAQPPT